MNGLPPEPFVSRLVDPTNPVLVGRLYMNMPSRLMLLRGICGWTYLIESVAEILSSTTGDEHGQL